MTRGMGPGLFALMLGYVLSQFYRAFLAVLAPVLQTELGIAPDVLATSSGLWFIAFALMQIPVGWALDEIGPRRTAAVLLALGGAGGAALFALAQNAMTIHLAMALIGIGCSPVLMASFFIFARVYPAAWFGTMAGMLIGIGSLGNLASALPLSLLVEAAGWRMSLWLLAAATLAVALALILLVRDPAALAGADGPQGDAARAGAGFGDLLRIRALWLILPIMAVSLAPAAALRGLWLGPYFGSVHGLDATGIGTATLVMALAMIVGNFLYGPLDRLFGTRKWVVLVGNAAGAGALLLLSQSEGGTTVRAVSLLAATGLFGASFPMIMAHGRSFVPAALTGRGVTLLNLFGIGGVGLMQFLSGPAFRAFQADATSPAAAYGQLFAVFALVWLAGTIVYLFSRDRTD